MSANYTDYYDDPYYGDGNGSGGGGYDPYNLPSPNYWSNPQLVSGGGGFSTPSGFGTSYFTTNPTGSLSGGDPTGGGRFISVHSNDPITGDPTSNPTGNPSPTTPGGNSNVTNNFTSNAIGAESLSNSLPPIAQGSPEGNMDQFTPQTIPTGRRMNPAGMDSGRNPGYAPPSAPPPSIYDPGQSRSGNQVPLGDGRTMPTSGTSADQGGVAAPSWKDILKHSALGITGVRRYMKLIKDARSRPGTPQPQQKSPYGF